MDRRAFLNSTVTASVIAGFAGTAGAAERFFPTKLEQSVCDGCGGILSDDP